MPAVPPSSKANGLPLGLTGATAATRYVGATASGAPGSGTFAVGDFIIDQTGKVYVCTVAGSPGTWTQVGGGAYAQLFSVSLSGDGTFDQGSIPGTYNDLIVVLNVRATRAASLFDSLSMRFNNDSGANYTWQDITGSAGTAAASGGTGATSFQVVDNIPAASETAGYFGQVEMVIAGYTSTTWNKTFVATAVGRDGTNRSMTVSAGTWANTAALTRIQFFGAVTANLLSGSTMRIYGRL